MTRFTAGRAMILAAATLSMGALAVNCSHTKDTGSNTELGSVGLAISLPSGATVSTVHYSVKNSAMVEVRAGDITTSDPGATVSIVIGGVASGNGYTVTLSATASDGTSCAGSSLPFNVTANMTTTVNVLLLCRSVVTNGTVIVNGTVDNCPAITSYTVSPLAVAPGGSIAVNAAAIDLDSTDTVTYRWTASAGTATAGTFASATTAMTTFTCPTTGSSQQTLTITASDNVVTGTTTPKCSTPATITVSCGLCGNGTVDSGEACDPAATPTGAPANFACNNSCQVVPVCGNSVTQTGEQCDPPLPGFCSATCQNIAPSCGDSFVQAGEQCDPPGPIAGSSNTCSTTCQIVTGGAGGSSGAGGMSGAGGSSGTVGDGSNAACHSCEDAMCAPSFRCDTLTGSALTVCNAAVSCARSAKCTSMGSDPAICYCGTADQDSGACTSGSANGPCVAAFEAADTNIVAGDSAGQRGAKIGADLSDTSLPLGHAFNQLNCDLGKCTTAATCGGQF